MGKVLKSKERIATVRDGDKWQCAGGNLWVIQ